MSDATREQTEAPGSWTDSLGPGVVRVTKQAEGRYDVEHRGGDLTPDLTKVPAKVTLRFEQAKAGRATSLILAGGLPNHTVVVSGPMKVTSTTYPGSVKIDVVQPRGDTTLDGDFHHVAVTRGKPLLLPDAQVRRLRASGGQTQLGDAAVETLELHGGELAGTTENVQVIELHTTTGPLPDGNHLKLMVPEAELTVGRATSIERIDGPEVWTLRLRQGRASGSSHPRVDVAKVVGRAQLELNRVDVQVASVDGHMSLSGKGALRLARDSALTDVHLGDDVTVHAAAGSALRRCTGQLTVSSLRSATVVADGEEDLTFEGITPQGAKADRSPLSDATLRGVTISDDSTGRQRLQELTQAAVVEPRLAHLRVAAVWSKWRVPGAPWRLQRRHDGPGARELEDAAFFAEELASLTQNKASSGAIRSRANWAAYRGRHLTSRSASERTWLGLYRLVGYGQIPSPPLLLWLLLAAFVTGLVEFDVLGPTTFATTSGDWPELFLVLLLSPLFLLRLVGDPALADVAGLAELLLMLMRAAIAIPFIFSAIAISRLLRADWRLV